MTNVITRLNGRSLTIVRLCFGVLVAFMLLVGVLSFFFYFTRDGWLICNSSTVECQVKLQYSVAQAADFERHGIPFGYLLTFRYVALLVSSLFSFGMGLFIVVRRSDDWMALLFAFVLIQAGTMGNEGITSSLTRAFPEATILVSLFGKLSIPITLLAFGLFPNGRPVPAWMRVGLPIISVLVLLVASLPPTFPQWMVVTSALVITAIFGLLLYSQILRYQRFSTPSEQKQTKWAVTGFGLYLLTLITGVLLFSLDPFGDNQLLKAIVGILSFTLLPNVFLSAFLGIAMLRSRLWDIDILIRRTLTYALVTAVLVIVFFGSVVLLHQLFSGITGSGQNELVTVLSTLAIAALFVPLRNRIQLEIDKHFNRRKYDAQKVLADFATTVRDETDLEKLAGRLMQVVDETMQPKTVSMWLKKEGHTDRGEW